ncbi:MAG: ABC transporter ATP-binding protein, partial [Gammaproteobacteria bacterium]|nr:ABC transporter ATP-binding protein [Gammaproteobacteria bacterium]
MSPLIEIENLSKIYDNGHVALDRVSLDIKEGELIALLGPNGAGKTTLISIICGLVRPSSGHVTVAGHDIIEDYLHTRKLIGLVPQELPIEPFESVIKSVSFSRGLFGKPADPDYIEKLLADLSLSDKKLSQIKSLSGGMKRRLLIAKALSHEPRILFLDEPTAGVDVNLRMEMWDLIHQLKESGVTVILTTHYIEEAEEMADRVAVINNGT